MIDEQIRDGDFVIVEDRKTRRQRRDGHRAAARHGRHAEEVLPRPGRQIRLQPANAAMQPIFVDPDQVQIQGVVVGVMRKY